MELDGARRVLVYGVCGSGKTTFAERVSRATGLPWHSVDDLTWLPGWQEVPLEQQVTKIKAICESPAWILDTAYSKWLDIPIASAEVILALDYPRWFSLQRLLRRTFMRAIDKRPVCNGNQESWRGVFSRDSLIFWHFRSFPHKRARIRKWQSQASGPRVIAFRNAREAELWLRSLASHHLSAG
jgi:adenylate kinase family enzyme